ncbi:hypothetical protein AH0325V1_3908 [Klebsiella pneumoniae]|nr:hypothetical protein AH0327V1_0861 [Klebsiella pneumoniae]CAE6051215.1 hypothetical protein AH0325V1_3908 [Klebsiella pneumoniae]CAE6051564.1 hypothetical protein AH0326V1_3907 [Klebsiella pneumoniae]CAE6170307.1 hypothetical protein AI2639V1_3835 [Klebsiella pneumoniae]CAE6171862.1 hypothetical protein AI2635V1_3905 [Klebsiella pneumoniae]
MRFLSPYRYIFGIVINTISLLSIFYLIFFAPDTSIETVANIATAIASMTDAITKRL